MNPGGASIHRMVELAIQPDAIWTAALKLAAWRCKTLAIRFNRKTSSLEELSTSVELLHTRKAQTDVFVVGGGRAGLAPAIAARRKGSAATVADGAEPPIDKACGEGMMPETQAALRELGVTVPGGAGYGFRGIRFVQGETRVAAEFPEGQGIGIRRTVLHELLIREAEKCDVQMLWKTPVVGIGDDGVRLASGTVSARWIVGADGGRSRVRRWSELDSPVSNSHRLASRRHYRVRPWTEFAEIYWASRVQVYVTPISTEGVCIVAMGETPEDADFAGAFTLLPELQERLAGAELCSRERGAITATQALARVWRGNVALVETLLEAWTRLQEMECGWRFARHMHWRMQCEPAIFENTDSLISSCHGGRCGWAG